MSVRPLVRPVVRPVPRSLNLRTANIRATLFVAGVLSLLTVGESRAQEWPAYWAVGVSFGTHEIEGRGAENGIGGRVGYVGFGGAADRLLLFGADASVWAEIGGPTSVFQSVLRPNVHIYPIEARGLFFDFGVGLAFLTESGDSERESEFGIAASAGLGYDILVGSSYRIRPFIEAGAAAVGRSTTLVEFGVALGASR